MLVNFVVMLKYCDILLLAIITIKELGYEKYKAKRISFRYY